MKRADRLGSKMKPLLVGAVLAIVVITTTIVLKGQQDRKQRLFDLFQNIHTSIYQGFSIAGEEALYDHLGKSFQGSELERQYEDFRSNLLKRREDQVSITIDQVVYEELVVESLDSVEAVISAAWLVRGVLKHLRHSHLRAVHYRSRYRVVKVEGQGWRIAASTVLANEDFVLTDLEREKERRIEANQTSDDSGTFK